MNRYEFAPIGIISSIFKEKFGVPRQSGMVKEAKAILKLNPVDDYKMALNHLEDFSHVWILFVFHKHSHMTWKPIIDPPRLEAPSDIGVFASRSPHRPNGIGLSAVKLDFIDYKALNGIEIHLSGVDFLDQTPVLDIKPYLPYADLIPEAKGGWANDEIIKHEVSFSSLSLDQMSKAHYPNLHILLTEILQWDPRPTSQKKQYLIKDKKNEAMTFAFRFLEFDVSWKIQDQAIYVIELKNLRKSSI
jgi:tRNA-Thr(GGU) m(6)t(6)A37 methyltransferase TsaA